MSKTTVNALIELIRFIVSMLMYQSNIFPATHLEMLADKSIRTIKALEEELGK